jgi:hypothetical protein
MKTKAIKIVAQLSMAACLAILVQACSKPKVISPRDIVIGEMRNGSPELTYPDYDRLKSAMALAFPEETQIDTAFLHVVDGPSGYSEIVLTAIGLPTTKSTEAAPSSINFKFQYTTGTIMGPTGVITCTPRYGCPGCIALYIDQCTCTNSGIVDGCITSRTWSNMRTEQMIDRVWNRLGSE